MNALTTIKNIAASAAIAGALSVAGLGLANGIATAAPADHAGSGQGGSANSEEHAHLIPGFKPKPATNTDDPAIPAHLIPGFKPRPATSTDDPAIPAHLIPGFTPKPAQTTTAPALGMTPANYDGPPCDSAYCVEVIDE